MVVFDPFREVDRLLGDVTRTPVTAAMPMDLYRSGDNFIAAIDLPGVEPASIDIDVDGETVTIRAQRRSTAGDDAKWLVRERAVGTFARQLTIGRGVASENIRAGYADGVLTLTIPVAEAAKPRKIEVEHQAQSQELGSATTQE